jgi:hypothetical protein
MKRLSWYRWVDSNHRPPDPQFDGLAFIGFAGNYPIVENATLGPIFDFS